MVCIIWNNKSFLALTHFTSTDCFKIYLLIEADD